MEDGSCALSLEVEQTPQETPLAIVSGRNRSKFTKENAAEMSRRAAISRAKNRADRLMARLAPDAPAARSDQYVATQIVRVRAQIEALHVRLARARDAKNIQFLSNSITKLAELERVLSGRPAPGQFRPHKGSKGESQRDKRQIAGPLDAAE